jgi:hypothetical protein
MRAFLLGCVVACGLTWAPGGSDAVLRVESVTPTAWPTKFDDVALTPLRLSRTELAFAADFPGAIARFRAGPREIVLRYVTEATRRLHPAADCLRATGHAVRSTGPIVDARERLWATFVASKDGRSWRIRERIVDESTGQVFVDVSSWWWAAMLERSAGPWWSWVVVEPIVADP